MNWSEEEIRWMQRALDLAARGQGFVEPNPMVGCVIVHGDRSIGEGWHQRFGGPHAEIEALRIAGAAARGATMYVTLEPCCHHGKTPPCVDAILDVGLGRVVIAERDPFPLVNGGGIEQLQRKGLAVDVGLLTEQSHALNAPFHKLVTHSRPWVIAKWAMSLDGKIATLTGESQWITNEASRAVVHQLRGRVDAIVVGRGTVVADDPLLTARPPGPRIATRIVFDSAATLLASSRLVQSAGQAPVLVVAGEEASSSQLARLRSAGCEVLILKGAHWTDRLPHLLDDLGRRRMTNVLVEGGAKTLGGFFEEHLVDEIHAFISPKVIGGAGAPGPVGGRGIEHLADAVNLTEVRWEKLDGDFHFSGRVTAR
jgi:diaminohydroxyphosphoribosylaminopyrimidine deaminase/5-amino-6-(5-phosphoribosylamino)uracil reductase